MNFQDYAIATIGSHTALQILKGAKQEGFKTICVCQRGRERVYESYKVADEIILFDDLKAEYDEIEKQLIEKNAIMIPHGTFVSVLGHEKVSETKAMYYGSKDILEWESDRTMERKWLKDAGLKLPKIFENHKDIDRPVIIKFHGAHGGKGYFIANTPAEFEERIKDYEGDDDYVIQEYIVGVPLYAHYFYSPVNDELEIMSFDKRYESNADSIGRIAAKDQIEVGIQTSYTITGNIPLVVRESLLPYFFELGDGVVDASRKITPKGLFGSFCLEGIVDTNLNYYVFEISARIVAGTNPFINGSPYTDLRYDEPMSTGRRIARDIKEGIEQNKLDLIID
jgi:5-formaminoimidazole-4-carboxamide-1-(beta)-D-ribofuranosyl 5'-monophosphate synthetase